eukprot:COSAG02_NODE_5861_length_3981_cov_9.921175_2_plen_815_part_00
MSLATMGKVDNHPTFNFVALATAERMSLHNGSFDRARGASSALWRGGDAARPNRAARSSTHLSRSRGASGNATGSMRLAGRLSIRGASRGSRRQSSRSGGSNVRRSSTSLPALEAQARPNTPGSAGSGMPTRPNTAGSTDSAGLSLGSGSVRGWFGSRPASREGVLEREERRARAKSRPRDTRGPKRNARGAYMAPAGTYPQRPDPWVKHRVMRQYEKAAEEERAASAWSDPELQQWLAAKEAQQRLGVGTWAGEATRLDGQVARVIDGSVPQAPLNRWHPRKEARLAEQRHGFEVQEAAAAGVHLSSSQVPDLSAKRQAAAQLWEDAHQLDVDSREPVYIDDGELESSIAYHDPVCGYRRGGADGSYSFVIATGTKSDLPAKRARAAALWRAYEGAYEPVDEDDEGPRRKNFSAIYATEEEAATTKKLSEWVAAKKAEYDEAAPAEKTGAEPRPAFDPTAATLEFEGVLAEERAKAEADAAQADDAEQEEVLLRECLRAICQAVDTVHSDEWRQENDPAYTLGLEGTQEEEAAAAQMQAIQRGRMERKRQLAMKKGNAIFGPLRFNLIISKFQAMWRGKMERRKVQKKTLTMQMKEAGNRDWTREIGVLEPEPEPEPDPGAQPETTPQPSEAGADKSDPDKTGDDDINPAVAGAQKALDAAKAEQKKAKDALEQPKQKLKKKAKNAARAALAEADKQVAEAERKLRIEEQKAEAGPIKEEPAVPAAALDYPWLVSECAAVLGRGGASSHSGGSTDDDAAKALAKTLQKMLGGDASDAELQPELFELMDDPEALDDFIPALMANRKRIAYLQTA